MKTKKLSLLMVLAMIFVFAFTSGVSAEYTFVQNDPDNATKFSIQKEIAEGFATDDLYVGTIQAYLGDKCDGKTPVFDGGIGYNAADILITNGKIGIVLAVATPDPWGYPGGSILDAGTVSMPEGSTDWSEATFGKDTVLTCQLLFNNWDAWAPVNAGMVYFDLVKYNFQTKALDDKDGEWAVKVSRKFCVPDSGVERDFDIVSYYGIAPGADYCYMFDTAKNNGSQAVTKAIKNQISLSNQGGDGVDSKTVAALKAAGVYNWEKDEKGNVVRDFQTSLITPGKNLSSDGSEHPFSGFSGAVGYREFNFKDTPYDPGESRLYESYLIVGDQCSWQEVYDFYADYNELEEFTVSGSVKDAAGAKVEYPVVIVYRDGTSSNNFYGWVMGDKDGNYSVTLPDEGDSHDYYLAVEAENKVVGAFTDAFTSDDDGDTINLVAGADKVPVVFNFVDAKTGEPVWGRVSVGSNPTAVFTGRNYFFPDNSATGELEENAYGPGTKDVVKGTVTAMIAPGNYTATCYGEGYNFKSVIDGTTAGSIKISSNTATNTTQTVKVDFRNPTPKDWYGIDNHHHGIRMDASAKPEWSSKAQIVAGLEVLTLDDHEYVLDNWPVYQWGRKMGATGYMPSEEVTASWAHFDIMPLSVDSYEQNLDRNQENVVVNTNQSLKGMMDQGHLFGNSIGSNHPTYSYGMLLADNNKTIPGGLVDDFDGFESQCNANYTNEAMNYWDAFLKHEKYRNVLVERPHYIWGSTDIHTSHTSTSSGSSRSYVYLENGDELSATDYDAFGLEFARSQAIGHSFVSSGVYITPATKDLMYGETYWADANGDFTAKFDISALQNISEVYVFSSLGTETAVGNFKNFKHLYKYEKLSGEALTNNLENYRVSLQDIKGKQWIAIAAASADGKKAFTNPIWINGPEVEDEAITEVSFQTEPTLPENLVAGEEITEPTSAGILVTEPWSVRMVEDWALENAEYGDEAEAFNTYNYTLTYEAPKGYYFSQDLAKDGFTVSDDGKTLTYTVGVQAIDDSVESFDDTVGTWMDAPTLYLRARGIVAGVGNNLYNPYAYITRADATALLVRVFGWEADADNAVSFKDEAQIPAYAKEAVQIAASNGIIYGYTDGNFCPLKQISRQELFALVYRALDSVGEIPEVLPEKEVSFSDFADVASYAKDTVTALAKLGIVNGNDKKQVLPKNFITRGECAQVLYKVMEFEGK